MNIPKTSQLTESGQPATEPGDSPVAAVTRRRRLPSLGTLLACAALAIAAAALAWLAVPHSSTHPSRDRATRPTVPVGYAVNGHGTAQITYTQPDGTNRTRSVRLPWQQTAALDAKSPATVTIVLGPDGGHATCALTLHGTAVQHATAYGAYGRATCTSTAP